jgi:hypothetical protein
LFTQLLPIQAIDAGPGKYYHVKVADYSLMQTKTLPKLPLDEISLNGAFYVFPGDSHPKTRVTKLVVERQHRQMFCPNPAGIGKYLFELGRPQ